MFRKKGGRRLPVIQEQKIQDCGACKHQVRCWAPDIREEHIISNLLTCRIKRGFEVNDSSRLFLEMVNPKLKILAKHAILGTDISLETALADLRAETIKVLMKTYFFGDVAYPLYYLFGQPIGNIYRFASSYARKTRKFNEQNILVPDAADEQPSPVEEDPEMTDATKLAREVVDDGVTLSLSEYRVFKFCLENSSDAKKPLNGLHAAVAAQMKISKAVAIETMDAASRKVAEEVRRRLPNEQL